MKISSIAFENNKNIPIKYTCDGSGINPPLIFSDIPEDAKSLVLIMDDPDAPFESFDHWVVFNISPSVTEVSENSAPNDSIQGKNSAGTNKYVAPCPPSGTHRYFFKLYALDSKLNLDETAGKKQVEGLLKDHLIDSAEVIGLYSRN